MNHLKMTKMGSSVNVGATKTPKSAATKTVAAATTTAATPKNSSSKYTLGAGSTHTQAQVPPSPARYSLSTNLKPRDRLARSTGSGLSAGAAGGNTVRASASRALAMMSGTRRGSALHRDMVQQKQKEKQTQGRQQQCRGTRAGGANASNSRRGGSSSGGAGKSNSSSGVNADRNALGSFLNDTKRKATKMEEVRLCVDGRVPPCERTRDALH